MSGPFKMKGSPMQRNFGIGSPLTKPTEPTEEELVAAAEKKWGKEGIKVKQFSDAEYKIGERDYKARRSFQSDTWESLSDAEKKKSIARGLKEQKK